MPKPAATMSPPCWQGLTRVDSTFGGAYTWLPVPSSFDLSSIKTPEHPTIPLLRLACRHAPSRSTSRDCTYPSEELGHEVHRL